MYKKGFLVVLTLFCVNTLLSVFSSCQPETYEQRCIPPTCLFVDSSSLQLHDELYGDELDGPNYYANATGLRIDLKFFGNSSICYKPERKQKNISLFPTAYALSYAPCPVFLGRDSIVAYNIYSNKDYDASHPAGSTLNELFTSDGFHKVETYNGPESVSVACSFHLDAAPLDTGRHIFTIRLAQADGDTITVYTPEIKLLK